MSWWTEYIDDNGKRVYKENCCWDVDALELQPKEEGRQVLVMSSVYLPWPKLSGVYEYQTDKWVRIMSMKEAGKHEAEPDVAEEEAEVEPG